MKNIIISTVIVAIFITITKAKDISQQPLKIFPINNAKFLTGQRFDFLVESDMQYITTLEITINGIDAQKFFNKKAIISKDSNTVSYRINNVSFKQTGKITILVKANNTTREIHYNVVAQYAEKKAKNVILLIGDGMSLQAKQMARILSKGIVEGKYNDVLEMEKLDRMALITTSGYDSLTTDSANSASAYATGHKSAVEAMGVYANSTKDPLDDPKIENIIEILQRKTKKSIGLVSTANITDATPAAMFSHTRNRKEQNFIALDMLRVQPDVILGGGLQHFIPQDNIDSKRKDSKNLLQLYTDAGYQIVYDRFALEQHGDTHKILGLFHNDNLNVYLDREILKNPKVLGKFPNQPTLLEMSKIALEILSKNQDGFFLMIEAASIDKQLHKMDWQRATYDTIEFDKTVAFVKKFATIHKDTLIIVVADHAHSASITGTYHELDGKTNREAIRTYSDSVFPTFEDKDNDGFPDDPDPEITLAVQYANHPNYKAYYNLRKYPSEPTINKNGIYVANPNLEGVEYEGNIPSHEDQEAHTADDVILMSEGNGSEYFKGVMDNTEVFFGMMRAFGLDAK